MNTRRTVIETCDYETLLTIKKLPNRRITILTSDVFVGAFSSQELVDRFVAEHRFEVIERGDGSTYSLEVDYRITEHVSDSAVEDNISTGNGVLRTRFSATEVRIQPKKDKIHKKSLQDFKMGWIARGKRQSIDNCPYEVRTRAYGDWCWGWLNHDRDLSVPMPDSPIKEENFPNDVEYLSPS